MMAHGSFQVIGTSTLSGKIPSILGIWHTCTADFNRVRYDDEGSTFYGGQSNIPHTWMMIAFNIARKEIM